MNFLSFESFVIISVLMMFLFNFLNSKLKGNNFGCLLLACASTYPCAALFSGSSLVQTITLVAMFAAGIAGVEYATNMKSNKVYIVGSAMYYLLMIVAITAFYLQIKI